MNWISACLLIFMTTVTGSITFSLWKCGTRLLEKRGRLRGIRMGLTAVLLSFLVPFLFVYKAFQLRLFLDGNSGPLFWNTPVLMIAGRLLFFAWAAGALWQMLQRYRKRRLLRALLCKGRRAGGEIQKTADRICQSLCIRRKIFVYMSEEGAGPWITGIRAGRIFLPEKNYGKEELEIILEHELRHYKQGDLILKKLCGLIAWIHWFNPFAEELCREVNKWGEFHCDLWLCNGETHNWDRKQYFLTILEHVPEQMTSTFSGMGLGKTAEEIRERMEKVKYYDPKKEWSRAVLAIFSLCFVLTSSVASLVAGEAAEILYEAAYEATEVVEYEEVLAQPEVSGEDILTYHLTVPVKGKNQYGNFYAKKGSQVTVAIVSDQDGRSTRFDLEYPGGERKGILGSGSYSHTFVISESGTYRAYVKNENRRRMMLSE